MGGGGVNFEVSVGHEGVSGVGGGVGSVPMSTGVH
jgi:hypothetical protein